MQTTFFARSFVPGAHSAHFVVCFQAPPTRLCPPCGSPVPNECARDSTRSPTSSMASGAIFRPSLGPRQADPARRKTKPADVELEVLDLSQERRRVHVPRPVASCIATRRARTPSCAAVAKFLQRFDNAPVPYPRNYPWLAFTTRGGRTGAPACSRSSRCARTTRSIDR